MARFFRCSIYPVCLLLVFLIFSFPGLSLAAQASGASSTEATEEEKKDISDIEAEAYIVMDAASGQILLSKNPHMAEFPASITKILTLALTLEAMPDQAASMEDRMTVSYRACHELIPGAAHVSLTEGEIVPVRDLLHATQIESANDAANALAEYNDGTIEAFAERMNAKAASLGLTGSHFVNPSGQPHDDHYTTAYDMATITRWALTVPGFRELFGATEYTMEPTNQRDFAWNYYIKNYIIVPESRYYYEGITGSKQGYTDAARYTLVTTAQRGDTELICVVLNCRTNQMKYESTAQLLDHCFDNYSPAVFPAGQIENAEVPVYGGGSTPLGEITVQGGEDISFLLHNDLSLDDVSAAYTVPEKYVVGEDFIPSVTLSLPEEHGNLQNTILATAPLSWSGLDSVFAANTSAWEKVIENTPTSFWIVLACVSVFVFVIAGRVIYVRYKRYRRRKARLEAALAMRPISLGNRPPPAPSRQRSPQPVPSPPQRRSNSGIPVYPTAAFEPPRRAGRVR